MIKKLKVEHESSGQKVESRFEVAKEKTRIHATLFRFLSRYRELEMTLLDARKTNANGETLSNEPRRSDYRATRGRVSPAISGNSNFKSRFRDYRGGNESAKEKKERNEGWRGKKKKGKHREWTNGSCWSFCSEDPLLPRVEKSSLRNVNLLADFYRHSTPCTILLISYYQSDWKKVRRFIVGCGLVARRNQTGGPISNFDRGSDRSIHRCNKFSFRGCKTFSRSNRFSGTGFQACFRSLADGFTTDDSSARSFSQYLIKEKNIYSDFSRFKGTGCVHSRSPSFLKCRILILVLLLNSKM